MEKVKILLLSFNFFVLFPYILYKYKKSLNIALEIGIFFGIIGFYFIPARDFDLYRYLNIFDRPKEMEYLYKNKIYIKFLVILINKLKLSKHFIASISAFIQYYFLFKTFILMNSNIKKIKNFLLILIFYQPLLFTGIRFGPAISIFIYGIIMVIKNYKRGYMYIILSFFIHYALIVTAFIFIVSKFFLKNISLIQIKRFFLFMVFIIYSLSKYGEDLLKLIEKIFIVFSINTEIIQNTLFYLKDKELQVSSGIYYNFNLYISLSILLYFYLKVDKYSKKCGQTILLKYILLLDLFCISFFNYYDLYFRYFILFNLLLVFYLIKYKINKFFLIYIYIFIFTRYVVQFYEFFDLITKSYLK